MLVEERDCTNAVVCLLCKTPFRVEPDRLIRVDQPAQKTPNLDKE